MDVGFHQNLISDSVLGKDLPTKFVVGLPITERCNSSENQYDLKKSVIYQLLQMGDNSHKYD
jgi:hypothetical protein